jgi:uncharacterized membrane protein (DUF106 family)
MSYLNQALRLLFDAILFPFRGMPEIVGLALLSAAVGVMALLIFKHTSNQEALEVVKAKIHAGLFEIRLFNDDLRAILRAQGSILRHNLTYIRHALIPLLWMIPPFVLIVAQMQFLYGYTGLEPGASAVLRVEVAAEALAGEEKPEISVATPDGLELRSPSVWAPDLREMAWLIAGDEPGAYDLEIGFGDRSWTKRVVIGDAFARRAPERLEGTFLNQLLYPAEAPLPKAGPIRAIRVAYPGHDVAFLGLGMNWIWWFLILSIVFAFALRNRLGVTI